MPYSQGNRPQHRQNFLAPLPTPEQLDLQRQNFLRQVRGVTCFSGEATPHLNGAGPTASKHFWNPLCMPKCFELKPRNLVWSMELTWGSSACLWVSYAPCPQRPPHILAPLHMPKWFDL